MTTYDPIERVRRARRQAATIGALVGLAALLVLIVVVRVWAGRTGPPPPTAAVASTLPADGGPDLRWVSARPGVDLPESLTAGPARHLNGRVGGFARTQLGAALAAVHLASRIDPAAGSAVFERTIKEQVIGNDADKLLENTSASYDASARQQGKHLGEPLDPGTARLAAWKVESQTPEAATVSVISEDQQKFFAVRLDLRWVDNDWHLVAPPGGGFNTLITRLEALPVGAVALSRGA